MTTEYIQMCIDAVRKLGGANITMAYNAVQELSALLAALDLSSAESKQREQGK